LALPCWASHKPSQCGFRFQTPAAWQTSHGPYLSGQDSGSSSLGRSLWQFSQESDSRLAVSLLVLGRKVQKSMKSITHFSGLIAAWNGPTPRPGCSVPSNRSFETGMETGVSVSVFVVRRRIYKMKNRCPFWG